MIKKFLAAVIVGLLFMTSQIAAAENYDIPSFRLIGGRNVTFTGQEGSTRFSASRVYGYDCSMDLQQNFAQQFLRMLLQTQNFKLTDHTFQDFTDLPEEYITKTTYETWYFTYTGSKKDIPLFSEANLDHPGDNYLRYKAHLRFTESKDYYRGIVHFSIKVARRLTYAGEYDERRI